MNLPGCGLWLTFLQQPTTMIRFGTSGVFLTPHRLFPEVLSFRSTQIFVMCPFQIQWSGFLRTLRLQQKSLFAQRKSFGALSLGPFDLSPPVSPDDGRFRFTSELRDFVSPLSYALEKSLRLVHLPGSNACWSFVPRSNGWDMSFSLARSSCLDVDLTVQIFPLHLNFSALFLLSFGTWSKFVGTHLALSLPSFCQCNLTSLWCTLVFYVQTCTTPELSTCSVS